MKNLNLFIVAFLLLSSIACNNQKNKENKEKQEQTITETDTIPATSKTSEKETNKTEQTKPAETASSITAGELEKVLFSGVEPPWTVQLKKHHVIYTEGFDGKEQFFSYTEPEPQYEDMSLEDAIRVVGENEIKIIATHGSDIINITVKKGACSDGMSDNTYPYEITYQPEGKKARKACGIVK